MHNLADAQTGQQDQQIVPYDSDSHIAGMLLYMTVSHNFNHTVICLQDQASRPSNREPEVVRPSKKAESGTGSGILGALSSAAFVHKPLSSNMQRLGSKMNIPSAIDTSGLVQYVPAKATGNKPPSTAAGASLLVPLSQICASAAFGMWKKGCKFAAVCMPMMILMLILYTANGAASLLEVAVVSSVWL